MKRNLRHLPHNESELDGLIEMGMQREALRAARRTLKSKPISVTAFNTAMNAILTFQDMRKTWRPLVESAYAALPKRSRSVVRFSMMSFYYSMRDYEAAAKLVPWHFSGDLWLMELAFSMETLLTLNRMDAMKRLVRKVPHALKIAEHSMMQAQLLCCWAEYLARKGDWNKAIKLWEIAQVESTFTGDAVVTVVEIHVARALRAIRFGFQLLKQFEKNIDPETEIIVPGNDDALRQQSEKRFRRLENILQKILTEERQAELGMNLIA